MAANTKRKCMNIRGSATDKNECAYIFVISVFQNEKTGTISNLASPQPQIPEPFEVENILSLESCKK